MRRNSRGNAAGRDNVHSGIHIRDSILSARNPARATTKTETTLTSGDTAVGLAFATSATFAWWREMLWWIPDFLQTIVLLATVIYVVYRALNEARKFYTKDSNKE